MEVGLRAGVARILFVRDHSRESDQFAISLLEEQNQPNRSVTPIKKSPNWMTRRSTRRGAYIPKENSDFTSNELFDNSSTIFLLCFFEERGNN